MQPADERTQRRESPIGPAVTVDARRPDLHDRISCVHAPVTWTSPRSGQIGGGFDGLYVADRRALQFMLLTVNGYEPVPISAALADAGEARFVGEVAARDLGGSDPALFCTRWRRATADGGTERIAIDGAVAGPVGAAVQLRVGVDLAALHVVAQGDRTEPLAATEAGDGLRWRHPDGTEVRLTATPPAIVDSQAATVTWNGTVSAGRPLEVEIGVVVTYPASSTAQHRPLARQGAVPWASNALDVRANDYRLEALLRQSESDLSALLLSDPLDVGDVFFAAGSPWYLTLFGRDALWAARLALPLGTEPLLGALRALARRQGTRVDADVDEEPGKILHEVRSVDAGVWRAPVYYGSIDATPLFISGVADALRWGASRDRVAELMPAVRAALGWLTEYGDADGDGFLEYYPNDLGLVNQSWKDSKDAVQWSDGRLAKGPLALCEVQAYAYRAALDGAYLMDEFALPDPDRWRAWAAALRARFLDAFLIRDELGSYPVIALDGAKRPVDGPASNMGHLLGVGILTEDLERVVASRLTSGAMVTGFGIRTMAGTARGFNPLGYHTGSIWPHDNAIAMLGMAQAGCAEQAQLVLRQLLAAAPHFGYRLPELYGGHTARSMLPPIPYPPACSPQAWSSAAALAMVRALLGLEPDAPRGTIVLRPMRPSPVGAYSVRNLRVCGGLLSVTSAENGVMKVDDCPAGVNVSVVEPD